MMIRLAFVLLIAHTGFAQEAFKCPHEYGFYPHHRSCDKYWKCDNNQATLKTCGNGLGFDATDPKYLNENCDYLHNVDCGDRQELEQPISAPNCPRLYGIFPDEQRCDTFWNCWNGESNRYTCAPGLAYDRDARVCMWADQVPECKITEADGGFQCPNPKDNPNPGTFSRHAHPEDCRKYYICLDGSPREYGCPIGTVFKIGSDAFSGQCTDPEGVEGCENYYGDELKNLKKSELLLGLTGEHNSGNYNGGNSHVTKPQLRRKVQQKPVEQTTPRAQPQQVQPQQQRVQQQRLRPSQQVQQQQQAQQQQQQVQPQQSRPVPVTTSRPAPTTQAPKPAAPATGDKNSSDDYYYYDNYEDVPATQAKQ